MTDDPAKKTELKRIPWPDYVKGAAIVLVVLGHLIIGLGLADADTVGQNHDVTLGGWDYAVAWIYSFHMPAFFFISGLFAWHTSRKTFGDFITAKLRTIAYPYFVWSAIQILLVLAMSGRTRHEAHWLDLLTIAYRPVMQFWFLYALFAISLVFAVLRKLRFNAAGIFAFSVVLYFFDLFLQSPTNIPEDVLHILSWICSDMIYFAAGVAVSSKLLAGLPQVSTKRLAAVAVICCGLLTLGVGCFAPLGLPENPTRYMVLCQFAIEPLLAALGVAMLCSLGEIFVRHRVFSFVRRYGVLSLEIYVAHVIAMAGVRITLSKLLHVDNTALQLMAGLSAGIYLPLALWWLCRRFKFPYLFVLPQKH